MKNFARHCCGVLCLLPASGLIVVGQNSVEVSYNKYVKSSTASITIELNDANITSFQVVNATSPSDEYKPRRIFNGERIVVIDVKVLKEAGATNVYYIDAYIGANRIDIARFSPSNKVSIVKIDDPGGQSLAPSITSRPGSASAQSFAGSDSPSQTQPEPPAKIRLQAPSSVANQSSVSLRIMPQKFKPIVGEYVIQVKNGSDTKETKIKIETETGKPKLKDPQDVDVALLEGSNEITVFPKSDEKEFKESGDTIKIACTICSDRGSSASTRALLGFQQVGASSSEGKQSPFLDFYFDTPFRAKKLDFSVWANVRLTSIPVQRFLALGNISAFNTFLDESSKDPNELAQSFDFKVGLETKLPIRGNFGLGFLPGETSMHLIVGGGAINPLSTRKTAQIFKVPTVTKMGITVVDPEFLKLFPEAEGKANIAFVSPERDKFFRQYFGGLRLKTRFFDGDKSRPSNVFNALVDITAGQNEAITSSLRGVILRVDGSTPLPVAGGIISIFGETQMKLGRQVNQVVQTLFLTPADSNVTLTSPGTVIVPLDRYPSTISNRDVFRIGIGVDLFRLFRSQKKE